MSALVDALCRQLAAAGVGAYSPDAPLPEGQTPITVAGMPPGDGEAITLSTYAGGPEPDSSNGWEYPRLQVRVRHANPLDAMDLERTTYDALQELAGELPGGRWRLDDCYALQSTPEPLGRDDNGRWEFVRNYQLTAELTE